MSAKRAEKSNVMDDFLFAAETEKPRRRRVAATAPGTVISGPSGPAMVGPSGPAMMGGPSGPAMMGGPSGPAMVGGPSGPAMTGTPKKGKAAPKKRLNKSELSDLY